MIINVRQVKQDGASASLWWNAWVGAKETEEHSQQGIGSASPLAGSAWFILPATHSTSSELRVFYYPLTT